MPHAQKTTSTTTPDFLKKINSHLGDRKFVTLMYAAILMLCMLSGRLFSQSTPLPLQKADPIQLWIQIPFEPSAFLSNGSNHLFYEMYMTNSSEKPIAINQIEVLNAKHTNEKPMAIFSGNALDTIVQSFKNKTYTQGEPVIIAEGETIVIFMGIAVPENQPIPIRLLHKIVTPEGSIEGAIIGTRHNSLKVLAPPLHGSGWIAGDGPGNQQDNHHRREYTLTMGG